VFIGDNGSPGEGTLNGLFNEQSVGNMVTEPVEQNLARLDQFGQPGSYNHYPVGWAIAGSTPFQLCKQYTHFGGIRNPLVVHWPQGIQAKGELRHQYHHVTDIVPTILEAVGVEATAYINTVQQEPVEGYAMNYSFDARRRRRPLHPHHPVLRDARQPRPVPRRLEDRHLPRPQAVGEQGRLGLRRGPLGAVQPDEDPSAAAST
jgi:arylsulfatase A-like enzyme